MKRKACECVYERRGHREGEGDCPYGPYATRPHPDGIQRSSGIVPGRLLTPTEQRRRMAAFRRMVRRSGAS